MPKHQNKRRAHRTRARGPYVRRAAELRIRCAAPSCGRIFATYSRTARYCSTACRTAGHRARAAATIGEGQP